MSTKCIIAINNGKSVKAIYCHWDGYPRWTGRILNENYTDTNKINRLIKLGDIDFLGKSIECNPVTKVFGPDWEAHDNAKYKDAIDVLNAHKRGLGKNRSHFSRRTWPCRKVYSCVQTRLQTGDKVESP